MHDISTRAGKTKSRQSTAASAVLLAALLFFPTTGARSASQDLTTGATSPIVRNNTAYEIAIEVVKPGNEGLELTARLTENGGLVERDINWTLRDEDGVVVFDGASSLANVATPPGNYTIEAVYGSSHFTQSVTLLNSNRLMINFVLDVGGIRILPRVKNLGQAPVATQSFVYALSGHSKGELITISKTPGEILRVQAGDYRIESRFAGGNAVAVADVHVKAGIMTAVEIDHVAGLARLAYVGAPDAHVSWQVTDATGQELPAIEGLSANIVLKPGNYMARATIGSELLSANFKITEGQARDILLGN